MVKKKQPYESPAITATRVELESSICAGSVDIANPDSTPGRIEAQKINKDFSGDDFNTGSWTESSTSTANE